MYRNLFGTMDVIVSNKIDKNFGGIWLKFMQCTGLPKTRGKVAALLVTVFLPLLLPLYAFFA